MVILPASLVVTRPASAAVTMTDLGTLSGNSSFATGINASGRVVGESLTVSGECHATLWTTGGAAGCGVAGDADDGRNDDDNDEDRDADEDD